MINATNDDGYIYNVNIEYDNGSLLLNRYINSDNIEQYKSYSLGHYEIVNDKNAPRLYDYGDYAIWIRV